MCMFKNIIKIKILKSWGSLWKYLKFVLSVMGMVGVMLFIIKFVVII